MITASRIAPGVVRGASRALLHLSKHSPKILTALGVGGVATGMVLTIKASLEVGPIVDELQEDLEAIHEIYKDTVGHKQEVKDKAYAYTKASFRLVKHYWAPLTFTALGVGCLLGANNILSKRNVALAAAYKALEESYDTYRRRVRDSIGEDKEREIYDAPIKALEGEDPKTTVEKLRTNPYSRFFDEYSTKWEKNADMNRILLEHCERIFTDKLRARGHVFLNEVYDFLGFERSPEGQIAGWIIGEGDDFVDLGLTSGANESNRAFINGLERSVLLTPNCVGSIWNKI